MTDTPPPSPDNNTPPPVTDWTASLPADLKDVVAKNGFTEPAAVVKAYASLQPLLGADKIPLPKDGVWDDFARGKLGIPAKPEEYKYTKPNLPEGVTWDENFAKAGLAALHKAGATPQVVQAAIDAFAAQVVGQHTTASAAAKKAADEAAAAAAASEDRLRKDWGQAFDQKLEFATRAATHLATAAKVSDPSEIAAAVKAMEQNPALARMFAAAGEALGEGVLVQGKGSQSALTPAEAQAEADRLMRSPEYTHRDPAVRSPVVQKVQELMGMVHDNTNDLRRVASVAVG